MPTKRFGNLPRDKQDRITAAAIEEFIVSGFEGAKVAGIIRRAGIPRGSFYQYFSGKEDVLQHLFDHLARAKLADMAEVVALAGRVPFTDYLEATFTAGMQFARRNPRLVALGHSLKSSQSEFTQASLAAAKLMAVEHYEPLIRIDQSRGLIRSSVDARRLAEFIVEVYSDVVMAMMDRADGQGHERAGQLAAAMFDILRHGILNERIGGMRDV